MKCKICGAEVQKAFRHEVLGKYKVSYFKCGVCGFLCAGEPFWLNEAYEQAITASDSGLLARNIDLSRKVSVLINEFLPVTGKFLDYAGGYGVFTRLMRDVGFQFFHTDPYTENMFAAELEWDGESRMDAITCFECVEHLENPVEEFEKLFSISKTLLISTVLLPKEIPSLEWDYYGFEHGQHISFYSEKTLDHIAEKFGCSVTSVGNLHLFSPFRIDRKRMKWLLSKADRPPYLFSRKTLFKQVVKKMKKQAGSEEQK